MAVSAACMAMYWPTPGFKRRTFKLCVLFRWDLNFCIRSSQLRGPMKWVCNQVTKLCHATNKIVVIGEKFCSQKCCYVFLLFFLIISRINFLFAHLASIVSGVVTNIFRHLSAMLWVKVCSFFLFLFFCWQTGWFWKSVEYITGCFVFLNETLLVLIMKW